MRHADTVLWSLGRLVTNVRDNDSIGVRQKRQVCGAVQNVPLNRASHVPVYVYEAALVTPRVEGEALRSTDGDEGLPIAVVEGHRGDREGSFVIDCRARKNKRWALVVTT